MALTMARPWKHPKTGVYWLRRGVPEDLRALVGKREEKKSLGTKDSAEAKRLHAIALAELEKRWARLKAGPRSLTERESHDMAAVVHDRWLEMHRDEPSQQTFWPVHVGATVFAPPPPLDLAKVRASYVNLDPDWVQVNKLETWCLRQADEGLATQGLVVDQDSRRKFAKAIAAAMQ
jgi:hypothetical protein